jgi:antitoxin CptB
MDWLVGRYAEAHLEHMDEAALARFERLLEMPDPELQRWLLDGAAEAAGEMKVLIADMRRFHGLGGATA